MLVNSVRGSPCQHQPCSNPWAACHAQALPYMIALLGICKTGQQSETKPRITTLQRHNDRLEHHAKSAGRAKWRYPYLKLAQCEPAAVAQPQAKSSRSSQAYSACARWRAGAYGTRKGAWAHPKCARRSQRQPTMPWHRQPCGATTRAFEPLGRHLLHHSPVAASSPLTMSQLLVMESMQSLCLPPATPALSKAMPPKKCFTARYHARQQDELTAFATFSATLHQCRESSQQSRPAQALCAKRQRTNDGQADSEGEQHLCIVTVVRNLPASSKPWCVRLPSGAVEALLLVLLFAPPAWCHWLLRMFTGHNHDQCRTSDPPRCASLPAPPAAPTGMTKRPPAAYWPSSLPSCATSAPASPSPPTIPPVLHKSWRSRQARS